MNLRKLVVLSVSALAVLGSTLAEARPFHRHGGGRALLYAAPFIAAGAYLASRPYYRPYYEPRPFYYPAPTYYSPPVYIEQPTQYYVPPQSQVQPQPDNSWYYCVDSQAYYPNVQSCPGGWQRQAPR